MKNSIKGTLLLKIISKISIWPVAKGYLLTSPTATAEHRVQFPGLTPDPIFLLIQTPEGSSDSSRDEAKDSSSTWASAIYLGDTAGVLSS